LSNVSIWGGTTSGPPPGWYAPSWNPATAVKTLGSWNSVLKRNWNVTSARASLLLSTLIS
jgi:hypothetical protein